MKEWERRGKIFKKAREEKGLKQEDIGKMVDKSVATISYYENGKKKIDFDTLKKMCLLLGVNLMEL